MAASTQLLAVPVLAAGLAALLVCIGLGAAAEGPVPPVPAGHPRVYVRPADLPLIRQKVNLPEFKDAWRAVEAGMKDPTAGAFCEAFVYLVKGDRAAGRKAVEGALAALPKFSDARTGGANAYACVYDWCYDLLSDEEKPRLVREFERVFAAHDPGYPAQPNAGAVVGHGTEGWLLTGQLPVGVAIYDESRKMYDAAAALFCGRFVPVRNFFYPGHAHHQGDSYNSARFLHDQFASWLFRRMGAGDLLSREQQFVPYQMVYGLRPDGQQLRSGDTFDEPGRWDWKRAMALLTGSYYEDPYLLTVADSNLFSKPDPVCRVFELLFRKPDGPKRPLAELPLTKYFPEPVGEMVARTGWTLGAESKDAVVRMRLGQYFFGNHQRKDFGTFQVYYRGALAIASGLYEGVEGGYGSDHWRDYYHQTISHNGLLIYDPTEKARLGGAPAANDGGQRWPNQGADHPPDLEALRSKGYQMGSVTTHEFGPDESAPDYSYLAGDITQAYTKKVSQVTRSMVTLNLRNASYPCALVVFDRVSSTSPQFKKTWLLHTIQEPQVTGRSITIVRNEGKYGGKLIVESLLPAEAQITKVGGPGREFWIESVQRNYTTKKDRPEAEPGAWRVEVSPAASVSQDLFLHVLTMMDQATSSGPAVRMIAADALVGARLLDRAVLLGRSGELVKSASFKIEGGGVVRCLVCDLQPGTWSVRKDGRELAGRLSATSEGKCIYFEGEPGSYSLSLVEGRASPARPDAFWNRLRGTKEPPSVTHP